MLDKSLKEEMIGWIEQSIAKEDFSNHRTSLIQSPKKMDSYSGEVFSAKVIGQTTDGKSKILYLVIKMSTRNKTVREKYGVDTYERELFVYDEVLPSLFEFQQYKGITRPFSAYPKCFKSFHLADTEVLVFENLKIDGFENHERTQPMNLDHIKLILRNYAKLHAVSFAMKDQNREEFNRITEGQPAVLKSLYLQTDMVSAYRGGIDKTARMLRQSGEDKLLAKFEGVFEKDPYDILEELTSEVPEESVIVHGDNWNNNYMFRYEEKDGQRIPTEVSILDWQLSCVHSPMLDVANFLYHVGSENELLEIEPLLQGYYDQFSEFLTELGSNPEELFPFNKLMDHWKRYSLYGLILCLTLLEVALSDTEDIFQWDEIEEEDHLGDMVANVRVNDSLHQAYNRRIVAVVRNCLQNIE